jgi:environmental stress-induced protein Ves
MIKLIAQSDYQNKIWKNGRGTTQEIAVSHAGDNYDWRMSMADIVESGPFSQFTGMDRILVLLTGPEIKITHQDVLREHSLHLLSPYQFSGDWQTSAKISEKGRDFNLIYRRDKFVGSIELINSSSQSKLIQTKNMAAVFCLQGKIKTEHGDLDPMDTLLILNDSCKLALDEEASYLFIQLNHIGQA